MSDQPNGNGKARGFGQLVTNVIKLGGLVVGVNEMLFRSDDPHFSLVLAVAALMITGGQGLETVLDKLMGK